MTNMRAPWAIADDNGITCKVKDVDDGTVASVWCGDTLAYARLITAAPDMLAALRGLVDEPTGAPDFIPTRLWDAARAAIAKAEGRT